MSEPQGVPQGEPEEIYSSIREFLGSLIGHTLVDITQHDKDEFDENKKAFVQLHFDDGSYLKFPIGDDGFDHNVEDCLNEH